MPVHVCYLSSCPHAGSGIAPVHGQPDTQPTTPRHTIPKYVRLLIRTLAQQLLIRTLARSMMIDLPPHPPTQLGPHAPRNGRPGVTLSE